MVGFGGVGLVAVRGTAQAANEAVASMAGRRRDMREINARFERAHSARAANGPAQGEERCVA
jgi:hypothetical protein